MYNETQIINFKKHLDEKGYSNLVIRQYLRKVKDFLKCEEVYCVQRTDHEELKKAIEKYLVKIPLSSQKSTIQAALHAYYYFLSGYEIFRRLNLSDFEINASIEIEIDRFRTYLTEVAKLSDNTISSQCNTVKLFLYSSFQEKDFSPEKLTVDHVRTYLTDTLRHISNQSKKTMIVRIRSYVRFLKFSDSFNLEEVLKLPMTPPVWKQARISKHLTDSETNALFSSYDQSNPTGIRNYAIARCLKDLGLRCSEVARLSLDDFDWLNGIVTIRQTKSHYERSLPLHAVTGEAIEKYLVHSRPATQERILFVRFKKEPGQSMGTSQVRNTVRSAAIRAGLENFTGTHMLRHTAAKEMINNGVELKMIADILGHESIETTSIYTKINFTQLQEVAGTWPEVRS
ncbi:tyrosine-type recombinase/integrase [Lentibacillus cibarius]|nr:site-specific integrase [Lentibacillus cibarius]